MKKLLFFLLLTGAPLFAQNLYRIDEPFPSISSTTATPYLVANVPPNSPILSVCSSPANQVPCTNTILTFDSSGNACPTGAQDTPNPQPSACQSTGDAQGNIGFWVPAGRFDYTVTIGTESFGPYTVTAGTAISTFGTGSFLTTTNLSSTTPGDCANWLAGNVLGDAGVCLTGSPAADTNVIQPADGSGNKTSFNVNEFNSITYAAQSFNWHQSPAGTLSAGVLQAVALAPCPLGLSTLNHTLYIDTQGTPEVIQISAISCTAGAASGTISFTPANAHSAGYRIRSATGGIKEASEWAKISVTSPTQAGQYGVVIVPPQDGVEIRGTLYVQATNQVLSFAGGYLRCYVAPCVFVGSAVNGAYSNITIDHVSCQPQADFTTTVGTSGAVCIEDNARSTRMIDPMGRNPNVSFPTGGYSAFFAIVQIDDDEEALIEDAYINAGSSRYGRCDTTLCSVFAYMPSGNAAILELRHSNLTLFNSNGVDNQAGNTLNIVDSVIQSPYQFAVRTKGGNVNVIGKVDGWYGESSGFQNPNGTGTAGIIYQGQGWGTLRNSVPQGGLPRYTCSTNGGTRFTYFAQTISSTLGSGPWLPIGYGLTTATGTCNVKWPPIGTAGTITYSVARCLSLPGSATCPTSLYTAVMVGGSANAVGTVATGLTPGGNCTGTATNGSCLLVDDVTASTSAGTGTMFPAYCPAIPFWPGYAVISNSTDAVCASNPMRLFVDEMQNVTDSPVISGFGAGVPTVVAQHTSTIAGGGGGSGAPAWTQALSTGVAFGGLVQGALVLQNAPLNNTGGDMTGRVGFVNSQTNNSVRGCLTNLVYADREAILATNGYRVANSSTNNCIGVSVGGTPANTFLGIQAGSGLDIYAAATMDGTSWLERLDANLKHFKVSLKNFPTAAPTGAAGYGNLWFDSTDNRYEMKNNSNTALKVGNLVQTANCGTTTTCSNVVLANPQIIIGSVALAGGTATITGITAFTSTTSYKCTATDTTSAAAVQCVHTSATSITLTGTGTDTIDYQIIGN